MMDDKKSIFYFFIWSENTPKVFNRIWRLREKSLSVHGDYDDFRVVLDVQSCLPSRQNREWRIRLKTRTTRKNRTSPKNGPIKKIFL